MRALLALPLLVLPLAASAQLTPAKPLVPNSVEIERQIGALEDLLATKLDEDSKRKLRVRLLPIAERLVPGEDAARDAYIALLKARYDRIGAEIISILELQGITDKVRFAQRDRLEELQAVIGNEIKEQISLKPPPKP
ncbi:hypothetical protein [Roseiterribacter gracilis]|uniref:Uncharacterized protein n=1 Tax=Roseiterribacter gracilis TaxID=2812848 RepID=A0A8S8XCA6_9PROT|nr:hypothetical protein TMPK1_33200 [Rhodospirillales bacterium TMPK1]